MMSSQPQAPSLLIDAQTAIGYLIVANGNAALAAARASKDLSVPISEPLLLAVIASDPTSIEVLANQMRVLIMLKALNSFEVTQMVFNQKVGHMSTKDIGAVYNRMLQNVIELSRPTSPATSNADPFSAVMRTLPPNIAEAVEFFLKKPPAAASPQAQSPAPLAPDRDVPSGFALNPRVTGAYLAGVDVTADAIDVTGNGR